MTPSLREALYEPNELLLVRIREYIERGAGNDRFSRIVRPSSQQFR